jgi:TnpA family transposase
MMRRFTRANVRRSIYKGLAELGKAIKTIFLCRHLGDEALRREIHQVRATIRSAHEPVDGDRQ